MKSLSSKDITIWIISIVLFAPTLLALNESEYFFVNLIGFAYIGLLFLAARTKIGKLFLKRLMSIEDKLFGKVGG